MLEGEAENLDTSLFLLEVGFKEASAAIWPTFLMFWESVKAFLTGSLRPCVLCVSLGLWLMSWKKPGLVTTDMLKY